MADKPERRYGYWRDRKKQKSDLPWPERKPSECISGFDRRAATVQRIGVATGKLELVTYKGRTESLLTGEAIAGLDFYRFRGNKATHVWPRVYVEHYLAQAVPPDPAFVKLINWLFDKWAAGSTPAKPVKKPKAEPLVNNYAEQKVPAENFLGTVAVNVDNKNLSDAAFREFIRNSLPGVEFPRKKAK